MSLAAMPTTVPAGQAGEAWHGEAQTVRELLHAETERLAGRSAPAAPAAPAIAVPSPPAVQPLRLLALYGVGSSLTAVLSVDGVRKEYRPGASLPYGGAGSTEYRLLGIVQGCALLRRGKGAVRTVCHQPAPAVPARRGGGDDALLSAALPGLE